MLIGRTKFPIFSDMSIRVTATIQFLCKSSIDFNWVSKKPVAKGRNWSFLSCMRAWSQGVTFRYDRILYAVDRVGKGKLAHMHSALSNRKMFVAFEILLFVAVVRIIVLVDRQKFSRR